MKFENKAELEFYDGILQPILMVDDKNKIIHCNKHAKNFLDIVTTKNYINKDINDVIKFFNIDTGEGTWVDFFNTGNDKLKAIAEIGIYRRIDIDICISKVTIENQEYRLLLISYVEVKDSFFNLSSKIKKEHDNTQCKNDFNYIDINDTLLKYDGENISQEVSSDIINSTVTGIIVEKQNKITSINSSAKNLICPINNIECKSSYLGKSLFDVVEIEPIEYNDVFIEKQYNSSPNIIERKITRKDGSVVYCEITTMVFKDDMEDHYIYLLRDITKRIKIEKTVINNRNSYVKLLELLPIGVMIYTNNKFDSGNRSQQEILGVDDINSMNSGNIYDMVHDDYKELFKKLYIETNLSGKATDLHELKMVKKDGTIIEVKVVMVSMIYEEDRSVIVLTQEITDMERAQIDKLKLEQTIKYDKLKTEFISNVSHELKTPLNIILSTVQLLQYNYKDSKDEQLTRYLDLTKINSYRLLRLINNLIDGTRIDVGNMKMNFRNYNIVKIVEDITMAAVGYVEEKGITLTFDTDIEEKIIGIDKDNIERIVLNLLSNAIKFSKENGIIEVQVQDLDDIVQIKVRDNGKGIAKNVQNKIFEKFVQEEELFTRSHEGSGVGLSLVKSIVDNHGGYIYVKSELGKGSEFIVELPNILSKNIMDNNVHTINQVSSIERIKIEFSDIYK